MSDLPLQYRNPGPSWGYALLTKAQRIAPRWLLWLPLAIVTWVAVAWLPVQRRHSCAFFNIVLGRRATMLDVWRHFFAYLEFLLIRLRIADGVPPKCRLEPENAAEFETLVRSSEPALFGTFHFGHSDLLGFLLSTRGRHVAIVRLRVANSGDTELLERQFRRAVRFIWVNEPENLLFAMKDALDRGDSLAMQCDRLFSSRTEPFEFLGERRIFPFAIYHLAILFNRPVIFCVGLPDGPAGTRVVPSPIFRVKESASREENLSVARLHFQKVLARLEALVREFPYLWFNFLPLNPVAGPAGSKIPAPGHVPSGPCR